MIRTYRSDDERSWLRCRALGFLDSDYYDDVKRAKTPLKPEDIELVAVDDGEVVALIDVEVDGSAATIDTIAVHPEHQRRGLATQLLTEALSRLGPGVTAIDAWTREDAAANNWYQRQGFAEQFRYLHVYVRDYQLDGYPVAQALLHAPIGEEAELRSAHERVYVCRQYLRAF